MGLVKLLLELVAVYILLDKRQGTNKRPRALCTHSR